ncbi:outer membrane lipoprotein-sorting protein [Planktotalea frisia]|jgi:outer membrane lipoprotein-sorting protein|uniref:Outer-membrane lipoprotein carrier protein n=1 Tax=Planktotalea frisia TaxID=696762 RepID=A0A1L9NX18_9RHOB|nr:outer membrane lipoprotein carrier protein LolA [Planktotalea frisia]OJI93809.1 outer-membrane lipoprotein carrier protein precursor [Planktotalea frisia]PZX30892.1 outer membrane lipoprotein-sorting protein [Planktotalea frisia]
MNIRTLLPAVAIVLATALPAAAQQISLNAISNYLNNLQTAKGAFTQVNDDGTISTGTIYIKRPGRIRFEYNPPDKQLVLASGGAVVIYDPKTNEPPETYPLARTPLSIILAKNVNLSRARMVVGHKSDGKSTTVKAQDPEHPEYGNIELVFTANPVELRQWVINDDGGNRTTVILGELDKKARMNNLLFNPDSALPQGSDR